MKKDYVEKHDEGYWVAGTRVSLDSVILAFLEGLSPETIATECFPILTLEQENNSTVPLPIISPIVLKSIAICNKPMPNLTPCAKRYAAPIPSSMQS
jgi:hypothetical protein